jgi:hypothetical protein
MSEHIMVFAELYQLGRDSGGFTKEFKTKVRDKSIVPRKWVDKINERYANSGKWYEVFEDETKEMFAEGAEKVKAIKEAESNAGEIADILTAGLKEAKKPKAKKVKNEDKEALLDKVEELTGERPHHLTGVAKLKATIEEYTN